MSVGTNSSRSFTGVGADRTHETGPATEATAAAAQLSSHSSDLDIVPWLAEIRAADLAAIATDGMASTSVGDSHVAMAVDLETLPDIDATLNLLFGPHRPSDVPVLDPANAVDLKDRAAGSSNAATSVSPRRGP